MMTLKNSLLQYCINSVYFRFFSGRRIHIYRIWLCYNGKLIIESLDESVPSR